VREGDRRRELERAVNPFGEKPGLERAPKSRGWRRGSKPQGSRHLCGGAPLPAYFEALKVSPAGFARVGKAKREGVAADEAVRASLEGGWSPSTRASRVAFVAREGLTWLRGSRSSGSRVQTFG
jgi:hypothetical protein